MEMKTPRTPQHQAPQATPPQPQPFLSRAPGEAPDVPVVSATPQNTRGPEARVPPQPEPWRQPYPQHSSLSVPEGPARKVAEKMGLQRTLVPQPDARGFGGRVFDRPSEIVTVSDHRDTYAHAHRLRPR
jgi:hypothetical protein